MGAPDGAYAVDAFTDTIVLGIPADNPTDLESEYGLLFTLAAAYQLTSTCRGVFVRGGIAVGQLWMDGTLVFGAGLINAYELETKKAVYPRVVDGPLADLAKMHAETYDAAPAGSSRTRNWSAPRTVRSSTTWRPPRIVDVEAAAEILAAGRRG